MCIPLQISVLALLMSIIACECKLFTVFVFFTLILAGDYHESKQALVSTKPRSVGARGAAGTSGSLSAAPHGSGTDMISKMKDQLDATTEMCQHLLQEQRKLSLKLSGMNLIIWLAISMLACPTPLHVFEYENFPCNQVGFQPSTETQTIIPALDMQ